MSEVEDTRDPKRPRNVRNLDKWQITRFGPEIQRWLARVGCITPEFLHAGWEMQPYTATMTEPAALYPRVAEMYNAGIENASRILLPNYQGFQLAMHKFEQQFPTELQQALPELNAQQCLSLMQVCADFRRQVVEASLKTRLMELQSVKGGRT